MRMHKEALVADSSNWAGDSQVEEELEAETRKRSEASGSTDGRE